MPQYPYNAPVGLNYTHINTAATTVVKSSAGLFGTFNVNSATSTATIEFYDNTSAAAPILIGALTLPTITTPNQQVVYNLYFKTGLTIVTTGTLDVDIGWR